MIYTYNSNMKKLNIGTLLFDVFTPLILGSILGILVKDDFSYLETLNRNIVVPPVVFIIVWSILYLLMGLWYYLYEKNENKDYIKNLYWISLFVNLMFTPTLFLLKNIYLALINVIILLGLIIYIFINGIKNKQKYSYLLLPYIIWLFVALTIMIDLVSLN